MARMRLLGGLGSSGEPSKNGGAHAALPTRARVFGRFPPKDTSLASDTERAEILKDPPAASASLVTTTEDGAHSRDLADEPTMLSRPVTTLTPPASAPVSPAVETTRPQTTVPEGPKPRASLLATVGLVLGLISLLAVLTGVLAKAGVILAVVAGLFSIGGVSASSRRHVAGRFDALLGLALSIGAIVLGVLAIAGLLSWLHTDVDQVPRLRDWLHARWQWVLSLRP
jgi:hypothetical protein